MKEILAAIALAAGNLQTGIPPSDPSYEVLAQLRHALTETTTESVAVGYCAQVPQGGEGDILFGAYTTAPAGVKGFVNIGNTWCGLRSTGERVTCPPPVTKCGA